MANIINIPIIVWKTSISLLGYVVCAVFLPEGLHSFQTGVSVHLDNNAFNCLFYFDKNQYESRIVSIIQYFMSEKQANDLEVADISAEEASEEESIQFEKKGSENSKINNHYGFSKRTDTILPSILSDKVSYFDVIKTDKFQISAGNNIVLSKRSSCKFIFCGVIKVANKRNRIPKYFHLVLNSSEGNKIFSFLLCRFEKKIESSNFLFDKTHIALLQSTAAKFIKRGLDTKIPHYTELGNCLANIYLKNRMLLKLYNFHYIKRAYRCFL